MLYTFSPFEFFFFLSVTFVLFSSFRRIDLFIVHIVSRSHLKLTYIQTIPNKPLCIGYLLSLAQVLYNNKFWAPIFRWTSPFEPTHIYTTCMWSCHVLLCESKNIQLIQFFLNSSDTRDIWHCIVYLHVKWNIDGWIFKKGKRQRRT